MIEFDPVLVHDWLSRSARRFPDKEALVCGAEHGHIVCWIVIQTVWPGH